MTRLELLDVTSTDLELACSNAFAVVGKHWHPRQPFLVAKLSNMLALVPMKQQTALMQLSESKMVVDSSEIVTDDRRECLASTLVVVVERGWNYKKFMSLKMN